MPTKPILLVSKDLSENKPDLSENKPLCDNEKCANLHTQPRLELKHCNLSIYALLLITKEQQNHKVKMRLMSTYVVNNLLNSRYNRCQLTRQRSNLQAARGSN